MVGLRKSLSTLCSLSAAIFLTYSLTCWYFIKLKLKWSIPKIKPILIVKSELRIMEIKKQTKSIPVNIGSIMDIIFNPILRSENGQNKTVP